MKKRTYAILIGIILLAIGFAAARAETLAPADAIYLIEMHMSVHPATSPEWKEQQDKIRKWIQQTKAPSDPFGIQFKQMSFADLNAWRDGLMVAVLHCENPSKLPTLERAWHAANEECLRRSAAAINARTADYIQINRDFEAAGLAVIRNLTN